MEHIYIIVGSSAIASLILLWVFLFHVLPMLEKNHYKKALFKMADTYETMNKVLSSTNAERFLILKTENGGGVPHPGARLFASVIYEAIQNPFSSVKEDYQRLRVDEEYLLMLKNIILNDWVYWETKEMPEGLLRRIYLTEGVKFSYIFKIKTTKKAFYYGSIATSKEDGLRGSKDMHFVEIAVSKIRNLFKNIK